jgi:hypothetical protein
MWTNEHSWKARCRASGIHLTISLAVAAFAAALVFGLWYPYPYREISGGRDLFWLIVTVDVVMGPLLTLAIFDTRKPWRVLRRDLVVIGLLQLGALFYGLWTVAAARPVHLVFEIDRFRVVHAVDVPPSLLGQAPERLRSLPLTGPTLLSVRGFRNDQEKLNVTMEAMAGIDIGSRPELWQSYEAAKPQVLAEMRPLDALKARFPQQAADIDEALKSHRQGRPDNAIGFIPLASRLSFWTVLLDTQTAEVIAFVPIDSF